jgi:hypothetical protein
MRVNENITSGPTAEPPLVQSDGLREIFYRDNALAATAWSAVGEAAKCAQPYGLCVGDSDGGADQLSLTTVHRGDVVALRWAIRSSAVSLKRHREPNDAKRKSRDIDCT